MALSRGHKTRRTNRCTRALENAICGVADPLGPGDRRRAPVQTSLKMSWVTLLILTFVSIPFVLLLVLGVYGIVQSRRAERSFFPVEAVVLSKSISEDRGQAQESPGPVYGPVVEYRYQVGGATCTCNTVFSAGDVKRSRAWADKICDRYQVGQPVWAYYNPAEPSQAFLLRGGRFVWRVVVGFGLLGLVSLGEFAYWFTAGVFVTYMVIVGISLFLVTAVVAWLSSVFGPAEAKDSAPE